VALYDNHKVTVYSLTQPDKENWMVCLYNEVLENNQSLIKGDKWYSPSKVILPPFSKEELEEIQSDSVSNLPAIPASKGESYLFYWAAFPAFTGPIRESGEAFSRLITKHKTTLVLVGAATGGAYAWKKDYELRRNEFDLKQKDLKFQQDQAKFQQRKQQIDEITQDHLKAIRDKYDCQDSSWTSSGRASCEKRFLDFKAALDEKEKKMMDAIMAKNKDGSGPEVKFPLILENSELEPIFKRLLIATITTVRRIIFYFFLNFFI
jgi:hypothetical protein